MKTVIPILVFVSLLSLSSGTYAQGEWKTYTTDDGLPDQTFLSLAADDDGKVWIGGMNRITCFDGKNCESYTVPGDSSCAVTSIAVDKAGNVWFSGYSAYSSAGGGGYVYYSNGVGCFRDGNFTFFTDADGIPDERVYHLAVAPDGSIWIVTWSGVARFEHGQWSPVLKDEAPLSASTVAIAPDGAAWFGGKVKSGPNPSNIDVYRYYNGAWETYPTNLTHFSITAMSFDVRGRPWIGAYSRELYFFDGGQWIDRTPLSYYVLPGNVMGPTISALAFGPDGSLWCGVPSTVDVFGGVYHLDRTCVYDFENTSWSRSLWTRYNKGNGLPFNTVLSLAVAQNGTVWAGTTWGLCRYTPTAMAVGEENDVPNAISINGNYPNPFNPNTTISFTLPETGRVSLAIYSISGQKVRELLSDNGTYESHGTYTPCRITWDGKDDSGKPVSSGVYIARLQAGKETASRKMLLMK